MSERVVAPLPTPEVRELLRLHPEISSTLLQAVVVARGRVVCAWGEQGELAASEADTLAAWGLQVLAAATRDTPPLLVRATYPAHSLVVISEGPLVLTAQCAPSRGT